MKIKVSIFLVFILLISTSLNLISAISTTEDKIVSLDTEISIVKPNGYLYIFNVQLVPLPSRMPFRAIIVGMVNVEVDVKNESINKVEFYVDDELKATITQAPYNWTWNERLRPPPIHNLKIIGYNNSTEIGRDEIRLLYVNPFRFGPQT
jgi:hypothetical protein